MRSNVERVDVDGLTIAYERAGDGPPLVLLHGGFSDHRTWRRQLESLSNEWTVVAWDAPGCGASSDPPAGFKLGDYADCVAGLVSAVGLEQPHVGGLSFGAGLALQFYDRHPELSRSLILASAYAGWGGSLPPEEVEARLARAVAEAEEPAEQWVESYLPSFFAGEVSQEAVDEVVAMMLDTRPAGMLPMLHAFAEADLRPMLSRISVPTLLLYGDADVRSPLAVAEEMHATIPTSQLIVLPGVGHASHVEAPDAFDAEVRRFLRDMDA
jgi:pimeloyl-ACP methyl ester carboxylesterase